MRNAPGPISLAGDQSEDASLEGGEELGLELSLEVVADVDDAEASFVDGASFFAVPDAPEPELLDRVSLESVL